MLTPVRAFFALSSNKEAQLDEIPKLEQSTSRKATLNLEQRQWLVEGGNYFLWDKLCSIARSNYIYHRF